MDKNGDGWVDSRDITGAVIANSDQPSRSVTAEGVDLTAAYPGGPACTVNFDKTNATLTISNCQSFDHDNDRNVTSPTAEVEINAIEFWVHETQVISSREGTKQTASYTFTPDDRNQPNGTVFARPTDQDVPGVSFALLPSNHNWLHVIESNFNGFREMTDAARAKALFEEAKVVRAYNKDRPDDEPNLTFTGTFIPGVAPALTLLIANTPASGDTPEAVLGMVPDPNEPGGQFLSDVTVEFDYYGDPSTIYPPSRVIGHESEVNRVTVSSNNHSVSAILQETRAASGTFGTTIKVCDSKDSDCNVEQADGDREDAFIPSPTATTRQITLPVDAEGDTITINYKDDNPGGTRTASVVVDPSGPSFTGFSPASGSATRDDEPTASFEARDGAAGISSSDDDVGSVYVVAGIYDLGGTESKDSVVYERNEVKLTEVTDGYAASVTIEEGTDDKDELNSASLDNDDEYEIRWWAVAADKAGNVGVSDRDGATDCVSADLNNATNSALLEFSGARTQAQSDAIIRALEGTYKKQVGKPGDADYAEGEGCDPHVVRVDVKAPALVSAVTGSWLDGEVEKSGTDAIRTSVAAVFHEELDCDTVSADDFTVGGSAPTGVTCKKEKVYLEVSELAADAKPVVVVADGSVSDRAGNAIGGTDASRTMTADDGIAAKLTVTVTGTGEGTRPVTDKEITIHIASDERLSGRPKVSIRRVGDDYGLGADVSGEDKSANPTGKSNEWSRKWSFNDVDADGLYNVSVEARDRGSSITATTGLTKFDKDPLKDSKAILFEVDNTVQTPVFHPMRGSKTDTEALFVTANFKDEGKEYGLMAARKFCRRSSDKNTVPQDDAGACPDGYDKYEPQHATASASHVVTNFDSHGTVTLVSATFDGDDVTDSVESRDGVMFVYRPGGIAVGEHTLLLKVKDNAGNENTFTLKFETTERVKWKLPIHPGANLISLPAEPVDGSIDAVFGGEPEVTTVTTYDGASGLWSAATRGADGKFVGDLTAIDAKHGYWVVSDGGLDVSVTLERAGTISVSPAYIQVAPGWNLVAVADVRQREAGTGIDTDKYFANIEADVAYGYDALTGRMTRLSLATAAEGQAQDQVKVGMGYWVYANEAGVIVP